MTSECAHCGLPLGRRPAAATIDGVREEFCCYGCALARQITRARGESGAAATVLVRLGLAIFFSMNAMMVTLPTYVSAVYGSDAVAHDGPLFQALRVLGTIFTLPVLALLGVPIVATAGRSLRSGVPNTDALIVLGAAAAWALSVANVAAGKPDVYFDTVVMLLILVTLGRYLEARARADAGEAVSHTLAGAALETTRLAAVDDGIGAPVAIAELEVGDLLRITPGEAFPGDAVVVRGAGGADQSVLTGEHRPVLLGPGSEVPGGTSSLDGVFIARLLARPADSAVARIERMLAEARRQRTPAQRLADRASNVMMPLVLLAALGAGLYWGAQRGAAEGLLVALAVLCVACPCGLGIATPVAVWTALRRAARAGVVTCNPAALESLARLRQVFFDKTGTLTERAPRVCEVHVEPGCAWTARDLLTAAAAVERGLHHPVARAIVAAAESESPARLDCGGEVTVVPGRGVSGEVGGRRLSVGSLAFAARQLTRAPQPLWSDGETSEVAVWEPGRLLGRIGLRESARADAGATLAALRRLGLQVRLLTGDMQAGALVPALIPAADASLGLLPEDKMRRLEQARAQAGVAMVGDGINDGPALACADVGIAVCSATDLARTTADVVLMTDDLAALPWLITYSRRVTRVIHQNLVWVFAYNAIAVAAAATGRLTPLLASLAMIGSSFIVVANSRRLGGSMRRASEPRVAAAVGIDLAPSRPLAGSQATARL